MCLFFFTSDTNHGDQTHSVNPLPQVARSRSPEPQLRPRPARPHQELVHLGPTCIYLSPQSFNMLQTTTYAGVAEPRKEDDDLRCGPTGMASATIGTLELTSLHPLMAAASYTATEHY
ncbi:hypothetical protein BRADI_4g21735v3 [Brachypodium distachyon]|uniref:Uncharacterized protein n=1 Tax=Brachypodium distachyon TaxID=15368 RepID=A0A2K2CP91_BRADI|nr:hypothetical protein BRADI_4g21735v3 [Brachypodium distachyon]